MAYVILILLIIIIPKLTVVSGILKYTLSGIKR